MNAIIVAIIVILFFLSPFLIVLYLNRNPKTNNLPKICQKAISECPHRLIIKQKKSETIYTYAKNNMNGGTYTIERFFDNGAYRGTININGSIDEAMQIKINKVEEELPDAIIEIIYPEES